jgi:hypothetical protein
LTLDGAFHLRYADKTLKKCRGKADRHMLVEVGCDYQRSTGRIMGRFSERKLDFTYPRKQFMKELTFLTFTSRNLETIRGISPNMPWQ